MERGSDPNHTDGYQEIAGMCSDVAGLALDHYGSTEMRDGNSIDVARWCDPDIGTEYELHRFSDALSIDPQLLGSFTLRITETFPNNEVSIRTESVSIHPPGKATRHLKMTADQERDYAARVARARENPDGIRVPPPISYDSNPMHDMQMILGILERGFRILENEDA